jgi:16S rRNA (guanine527-N7)-methyltransferase
VKDFIIKEFEKINIYIDEDTAAKFLLYYNLLIEWNGKFNLTAVTKFEDAVVKHFVDSACGLKYLKGGSLCDIGAGAGFPSLPLKILKPEIELTMLEARNKKVSFLNEAVMRLRLQNCRCFHLRAEEAKDLRQSFDTVTARAVGGLPLLCEYALPLLKKGGVFIAYKTGDSEVAPAQKALNAHGGKIKEVISYTIGEGYKRALILIEKIK